MVETKNDYSSIKVHKRASSANSNASQPSDGMANPTSSANTTTSGGDHPRHRNTNTAVLEKARAARRRTQYLSAASHAAKLAEDHCTHTRSNWRAAQKAKGVARPCYRRPKPSHFCQELKRLGNGPVSAQRRCDLAARAREELDRQANGLERKKRGGKELRETLLGMKAYFGSVVLRDGERGEAGDEDSESEFEALRRVLEPVDQLLSG